jgi:hypothetical protein
MKIREGAYYRTRDGDVVGPMAAMPRCDDTFAAMGHTWNEDGSFVRGKAYKLDLIYEVYVSDTPPVLASIRTGGGGGGEVEAPAPGAKTLRDEFAMAALQGMLTRHADFPRAMARNAYEYADAMMEARKK